MKLNDNILRLLQNAGLTKSEARFYIVVQKNPGITLREIRKRTRLSQTSIYRAFEHLKQLGLIISSNESWRKNIFAVSLHKLAEILAGKQRKLRKVELELKRMGNLLSACSLAESDSPMQIITGKEYLQKHSSEIISRKWDHLCCYGSIERIIDCIGKEEEYGFVDKRCKKARSVDIFITEIGEYARDKIPFDHQEYRRTKIALDSKNTHYCTYILDDEVTIWERDFELGDRAIVISDPILIRNYESMFQHMWKTHA